MAQVLADMKPRFIRFPGGCLSHGDGLGTCIVGKIPLVQFEQRKEQRNIWGYNQTAGLGYFEFFPVFCEDIGAKPLPVLLRPLVVRTREETWSVGGTWPKGHPDGWGWKEYVQEVLDLIEWANGSVNTEWGAKRAATGHPAPFHFGICRCRQRR